MSKRDPTLEELFPFRFYIAYDLDGYDKPITVAFTGSCNAAGVGHLVNTLPADVLTIEEVTRIKGELMLGNDVEIFDGKKFISFEKGN